MIRYTNIVTRVPETGGKHYDLRRGQLIKRTVGYLVEGVAYVDAVTDMADFAAVLNDELEAGRNILTYGIPTRPIPEDGLPIMSRHAASEGDLTRTKDDFEWPDGPAILAADYDPRDGHPALSRGELLAQVTAAAPRYADHDVVWGCSSSSYVYHEDGTELTGLKGQRLYIGVEDGADIPRAADVLIKRLWLAGHGHIMVSESGAQLVRATLDNCMYQPERLDYAAGAVCGPRLEQRRPPAHLICEGLALADTRTLLPDLTDAEDAEYHRLVAEAKAATVDEAFEVREGWLDGRADEAARAKGGTEAQIRRVAVEIRSDLLRAVDDERPVLDAAYVLHLSNGQSVSVGDVLRDGLQTTTRDPLEPNYRGGATTGIIYPYSRRLVSQAHGHSRTYILATDAQYRAIWAEKRSPLMMRPKALEASRIERMKKVKL